jgi:UDP-N-acetylmuramoyl-tripeptide--D-alanyl-D-alanine ligase
MRRTTGSLAALLDATLHGDAGREVTGVAIDSRHVRRGDLFVALPGERADGHDFVTTAAAAGAAAALVARSVPAPVPLLRTGDTLAALQRLARIERSAATYRLAAVTGSIGKTTTKEFLAALLASSFLVGMTSGSRNSQAGFPAELCNQPDGIAWMVAELGMNHAGELDRLGAIAQPDALLYTVVAPVHLEFFPDVDAIARAKAELIPHLRHDGLLVVNAADPRVAAFAARYSGRVLRYGLAGSSDLWIEAFEDRGLLGSRFLLTGPAGTVEVQWAIPGRHHATNLLAAATLALAAGVPPPAVAARASALKLPPRRGEVHRIPALGVTVVDDSYNSSPQAAAASLSLLATAQGRRVAVLGEMLELGPASAALHRTLGREAAAAAEVLSLLRRLLRPGDVVLVKGSRGVGLDLVVDGLLAGGH